MVHMSLGWAVKWLCVYLDPILLAYQLHALPCGSSHRPLSPGTACRVDNRQGVHGWRTKLVLCRERYSQQVCVVAHEFSLVTQTNLHTWPQNLPPLHSMFLLYPSRLDIGMINEVWTGITLNKHVLQPFIPQRSVEHLTISKTQVLADACIIVKYST